MHSGREGGAGENNMITCGAFYNFHSERYNFAPTLYAEESALL